MAGTRSAPTFGGEGRHGGSRPQLTGKAVQCLPPLCARPGSDRQPECSIIEFGRGRPQARFSGAMLTVGGKPSHTGLPVRHANWRTRELPEDEIIIEEIGKASCRERV